MTTPQQPPQNVAPPPPQPQHGPTDAVVGMIVTAIIAGWSVQRLMKLFQNVPGVNQQAIAYLQVRVEFVNLINLPDLPNTDSPANNQRVQNAYRRASYMVAAALRMSTAFTAQRLDPDAVKKAWAREIGYMRAHLQAQARRNMAAQQVGRVWRAQGKPALLGWKAKMDSRTTAECRAAHGRNFDPKKIPVIGYPGTVHPHCFPSGTRVSSFGPAPVAAMRRWYSGPMVEIRTTLGHILTGTPNHPVLTPTGWLPLGSLNEGADVFSSQNGQRGLSNAGPDEHQVESSIQDVFSALQVSLGMIPVTVPVAPEDFYGDGTDGQVDIVTANGLLGGGVQVVQPLRQQALAGVHDSLLFVGAGALGQLIGAGAASGGTPPTSHTTGQVLFGGLVRGDDLVGFLPATQLNAETDQSILHRTASDAILASQAYNALSSGVLPDQILGVRWFPSWSSHVYDLTTSAGWYAAEGVIVHNCRCVPTKPYDTPLRVEDLWVGMPESSTIAASNRRG